MAEENNKSGAQFNLGQLFIDFGTKGLPGLVKGLGGLAGNFLGVARLATQALKPIVNMGKESGNSAVGVAKLANSLDTSWENIQKLENYLEGKNVSKELINDLGTLQTTLRNTLGGYAELPGELAIAFKNAGLDLGNYSENFEDILQLIKDIQNANLSRSDRNMAFDFFGLSRDWGYLFDRGDFNIQDALSLDDSVIEQNIRTAETSSELNIAFKGLKDTVVNELGPVLIDWMKFLKNWIDNFRDSGLYKTIQGTKDKINKGVETYKKIDDSYKNIWGPEALAKRVQDKTGYHPTPRVKGTATGGAASIVPPAMENAGIPSDLPNISQTNHIEITNQNHITGDNAREIASQIAQINSQDIEYQQYQLSNLPGL